MAAVHIVAKRSLGKQFEINIRFIKCKSNSLKSYKYNQNDSKRNRIPSITIIIQLIDVNLNGNFVIRE